MSITGTILQDFTSTCVGNMGESEQQCEARNAADRHTTAGFHQHLGGLRLVEQQTGNKKSHLPVSSCHFARLHQHLV